MDFKPIEPDRLLSFTEQLLKAILIELREINLKTPELIEIKHNPVTPFKY